MLSVEFFCKITLHAYGIVRDGERSLADILSLSSVISIYFILIFCDIKKKHRYVCVHKFWSLFTSYTGRPSQD